MPRYLIEGSYSSEGAKGVAKEGGTARKQAVEQLAQSMGGRLEAFYFTFGTRDYVSILDLPDNTAAAAVSLAVAATGSTRPTTTPIMTPEEFDQILRKQASYRAPGR